jgi:sec-independent protein translocase protein TatB
MMGIGFSELVVIILVVLIFIKPDDLPAFFRKLGKLYVKIKKAYDELTAVKDEFIREIEGAAKVAEAKAEVEIKAADAAKTRQEQGPEDTAGTTGPRAETAGPEIPATAFDPSSELADAPRSAAQAGEEAQQKEPEAPTVATELEPVYNPLSTGEGE